MNKIGVSGTSDGDFNIADIYLAPEIVDDSDINSTNGDEIDICLDDENSVNFFIGKWGQPHSPDVNYCVLHIRPKGHWEPSSVIQEKSNECEVLVMHLSGKYWKWPLFSVTWTCTISLMHVKNSIHHFCLWQNIISL